MTRFVSMTDILRSHVEPYVHLSWFLYEAMEREHRLNLEAYCRTLTDWKVPIRLSEQTSSIESRASERAPSHWPCDT